MVNGGVCIGHKDGRGRAQRTTEQRHRADDLPVRLPKIGIQHLRITPSHRWVLGIHPAPPLRRNNRTKRFRRAFRITIDLIKELCEVVSFLSSPVRIRGETRRKVILMLQRSPHLPSELSEVSVRYHMSSLPCTPPHSVSLLTRVDVHSCTFLNDIE
jgi:hypothetical protein